MFKSISIIGVGSLGGFVAQCLSELQTVENLIIVDNDLVEEKNLKNSIYRKKDIGSQKVFALEQIIRDRREDINVIPKNEYYDEEKTKLPISDLIIDCRDITCNRRGKIDARLYISSRYLVIDCRKFVDYEVERKGRYTELLSKTDIITAALSFSLLVRDECLYGFMNERLVYNLEIDYLSKHTKGFLQEKIKKVDSINDYNKEESKFVRLEDNIQDIINLNDKSDMNLNVVLDSSNALATIPISQNKLKSREDVIKFLNSCVENPVFNFSYYVVSINNQTIQLIPETGAA